MNVSTILFEYNYLPILHFEKALQLHHIDLFAPKLWGYKDTCNIDYLCQNKHVVKDSVQLNDNIEAIIINKANLNNYNDDSVDSTVSDYFKHFGDASVFDLRNRYTELSYNSQVNNMTNLKYIYDLYDSSIIIDNYRSKKVFVFASTEGDQTSLYSQLSLFDYLSKEKQAVVVPSSKIISTNKRVVNFDWALYNRLSVSNFYRELRLFVDKIIYADADYLIIGIPEKIMNIDKKCDKGVGIILFLLSQILKIDALVINIPNNGFSSEVLSEIRELMKKRYECNDVYIINSNILYLNEDSTQNAPMFLTKEKLDASGAQNHFGCNNSFSIFDELSENVFSKAILKDHQ